MKNNKLSFLFLLCCFLILTSCKKEHIHSVSGPQIHDEYTHWFPCECGYKLFVEPHLYSDWNVLQSETCEDNGVKERTCYCGRVENEVIEKKGHSICSYFSGDEIHHWNPCSNCDKQFNFSRHTFGEDIIDQGYGCIRNYCITCGCCIERPFNYVLGNSTEITHDIKKDQPYYILWTNMIQCDDRSFVFNIKCGNEFIDPNLYDVEIYTFNSSSDSNGKVIGTIRGKEYVYQMPTNMEENFVCILVNAKEDILNCKALFDHDHKYSEKFISSGFGSHYRLCECGSKIDYDSHDFEIIYVVDSLNSNKIVVKKHCTLCDTLIDTEDSYTIENSIRSDNCNAKIVLQSAYEFTPKESGEYKFSIKEYDSPYLKFVAVDWLNNLLEVTKENNEFTIFLTKDQQIYFYLELFEHREEVNLHYEHVHTYSDSWSNNSEYHWKTNTCCPSLMSEAEKSEHEYVNMIAEWKNYYPYCGIIYEVCNVCKYQNEFIEQVDARAYTTPLDIGTYVGKKECFVFDTTHHLGDNKTVKLWMVDNKTKEVINPDNYSIVVNDSTLTLIDVSLLEENDQTKGYLFDVNNETNFIFVKYDIQFAATLYIEFVE